MRALTRTLRVGALAAFGAATVAAALSVVPAATAVQAPTPPRPDGCTALPAPDQGTDGVVSLTRTLTGGLEVIPDPAGGGGGGGADPAASIGFTLGATELGTFQPALRVWDVNLRTVINHPAPETLRISLTHTPPLLPDATVLLFNGGGGGGAVPLPPTVFNGTWWDDQARVTATPTLDLPASDRLLTPGLVATEPELVPIDAMGAFIGRKLEGNWTLIVEDQVDDGITGTLTEAELEITTIAGSHSLPTVGSTPSTPIAIPNDGVPLDVPLDVPGTVGVDHVISDLDLTTSIAHTIPSELDISLESPSGNRTTISTGNGDDLNDVPRPDAFNGTLWNDQSVLAANALGGIADAELPQGTGPVGPFVPEGALAAFNGESAAGTWTLRVVDTVPGLGAGTVNGASVQATSWSCDTEVGVTSTLAGPGNATTVPVGTSLTQTVQLTNTGNSASNVVVDATIPAGTSLKSTGLDSRCAQVPGDQKVRCVLANLNEGTQSLSWQLDTSGLGITTLQQNVPLSSNVTMTANEDQSAANNSASASATVRPISADLSLGVSAGPNPVILGGGGVIYGIDLSNLGPEAAVNPRVSVAIPPGAGVQSVSTGCEVSGGLVICNYPTMAPGARMTSQVAFVPSLAITMATTFVAANDRFDTDVANNAVPTFVGVSAPPVAQVVQPAAVTPEPVAKKKAFRRTVRFRLPKNKRVRLTVLSPNGKRVWGRMTVHGRRGINVVVLPTRASKRIGKRPIRVLAAGARRGKLTGASNRRVIVLIKPLPNVPNRLVRRTTRK